MAGDPGAPALGTMEYRSPKASTSSTTGSGPAVVRIETLTPGLTAMFKIRPGPPNHVSVHPPMSQIRTGADTLITSQHPRSRSFPVVVGDACVTVKPAQTRAMCRPVATTTPSVRLLVERHIDEGVALLAHCLLSICPRAIAMASPSTSPHAVADRSSSAVMRNRQTTV